jgi:hypothetical protein
MADKKISALTAATTPLAGTEVLPIVQSGSTVKVSAANLTAGRTVSAANYTIESGGKISSASDLVASVASSANSIYFGGGGTPPAQVWLQSIDTAIVYVNGATRLTTDNVGNHTVNTGNLVIGTAGKGIDFSAATHAAGMTSELLNDYEEGTWTPADASGASLSFTFSATSYYTKIGNVVTCNLDVTYPATADASVARITLPFTPKVSGAGGNIGYTTKAGGIYVSLSSAGSFTFTDLVSNFLTNANMSTTRSQLSFSYIAA